jgi:hypothetical protein
MPTLNLVAGDYDIDSSGHHVCDENGFAILLTEPKEVTVTVQTDYDRIEPILEDQRVRRGLNTDGSPIEE